jgi:alkanesulfonate monooxygenase SsuD/methylene tetrahydromethanopterin reductase-like flavin-dependent oxidoreductase (luciferase family)
MTAPSRPPVGVLAITSTPPEQLGALAARVEDLGFAEFWVAEDYFFYGGMTSAALALTATREIPVGLGLVSAPVRHPAVTAMEIANLGRVFPGRFLPTVAVGLPIWLDQMGLRPPKPVRAVRECVTAVRSLLAGETLLRQGEYFTFNDVTLVHPPAVDVPLYVGGIGPNMLRLAGEVGDGALLSVLATREYVRWARKMVDEGIAAAGSDRTVRLPVYAFLSVGRDSAAAKASLKPVVAFYLAAIGPGALTDAYGDASAELAAMLAAGGPETVAAEMPDAWLEDFAIAGDPEECAQKIARYLDAGADIVVVSPMPPETAPEMLDLVSREVLPRL